MLSLSLVMCAKKLQYDDTELLLDLDRDRGRGKCMEIFIAFQSGFCICSKQGAQDGAKLCEGGAVEYLPGSSGVQDTVRKVIAQLVKHYLDTN